MISLISHIACKQHYGVLISCRALIINLGIVDRYESYDVIDVCDYSVDLMTSDNDDVGYDFYDIE